MANTKTVAVSKHPLGLVSATLLRRSLSKLLSCALLVGILPVSPLPDVRFDLDDTKIEEAGSERQPIRWTTAMEHELADRWHRFQSREDIAREMDLPVGAVRIHATRLGLAARPKQIILSG